eukprot:CAMPEP_0118637946 /NCGR_PEP_ID=MMETSP0785-20121206/3423_1 /TAXON_ID=91992 /ORGANISM="Bolidomonas pacifica, Strain CCMP 1866" /LENGTH=425 /DNA_ID=CAMNT_0006529165 /DNA_START=170 /DNA_END=1443 /DNA_ORIENTATION=-
MTSFLHGKSLIDVDLGQCPVKGSPCEGQDLCTCSPTGSAHTCNCGEPKANHNGCCNCWCGTCDDICASGIAVAVEEDIKVETATTEVTAGKSRQEEPRETSEIPSSLNTKSNDEDVIKRYETYTGEWGSTGNHGLERDNQMSKARFAEHLITGEPFIVHIPPEVGGYTSESFPKTIDEWTEDFEKNWAFYEPSSESLSLWQGRISDSLSQSYSKWSEKHNISFSNFKEVRERWPGSYMSIVANSGTSQDYLRSKVFSEPAFIPKGNLATSMWMYAGDKGAGVVEHIDTVGCVCSWSYMLFGEKKWWLGSPPGTRGEKYFEHSEVIQGQYDFIFWCVGYKHETIITSEESLDIHGYVNLNKDHPDAFSQHLTSIHESLTAPSFWKSSDQSHYGDQMDDIASRCRDGVRGKKYHNEQQADSASSLHG